MPSNFYRQAAWFSTFLERYVLSVFYIAYAWAYFLSVRDIWPYLAQGHSTDFADFARAVSMLLLLLFEGLTLLAGRRAVTTPENLAELLVPIATSFYYLVYAAVPWLPGWMQESLAPDRWQWPIQVTGVTVDTLGAVISMWGVLYLGRSFGIFVAVRKVVLRGPYRYVRHPIYCGYLFMFAGVALTYFCPAMLVLVPIHYWLFFYRARLEEARLAKFSPEYRAYMKGTGFMLPRLRKANG